jgi:hypothetical protein
MNLTGAEITCLIGMLTALVGAMAIVWRAASMMTAHDLRLASLEKSHSERREWERGLEKSLDEITRAIYEVRSDIRATRIRASQGAFDEGNTEPPERNRR